MSHRRLHFIFKLKTTDIKTHNLHKFDIRHRSPHPPVYTHTHNTCLSLRLCVKYPGAKSPVTKWLYFPGMLQALCECLQVEQAGPRLISPEDWQIILVTTVTLSTSTVSLMLHMLAGGQTGSLGPSVENLFAKEHPKLWALVCDIFPPTTAIIDYTKGLRKLYQQTNSFSLVLKWQKVCNRNSIILF